MLRKITCREEELLENGFQIWSDNSMVGFINLVMENPEIWNVYRGCSIRFQCCRLFYEFGKTPRFSASDTSGREFPNMLTLNVP